MMFETIEAATLATPWLGRFYANRAARLKKDVCLTLHRFGRLKPTSFVQWICTRACNLSCPYCEARAGKAGADELTTAEAKAFIDDLAAMRAKRWLVSGGEPLMRADLPELLEYGQREGLELGLVSNGYLTESHWGDLRRRRFFLYFTSIDGLADYNNRVRGGKEAFQRAMDSLRRFAELKTPVRILNTVVHAGNFDQLPELFDQVVDSRATLWRLAPVAATGRALDAPNVFLKGPQLRRLVEFVGSCRRRFPVDLAESHAYLGCFSGRPPGKPFFCGAGLTRASVLPDGTVVGCQVVEDKAYAEGNLRQRPFSEIWRTEFSRFRQRSLPEPCKDCRFAAGCGGGCWGDAVHHGGCLKSLWFTPPCHTNP